MLTQRVGSRIVRRGVLKTVLGVLGAAIVVLVGALPAQAGWGDGSQDGDTYGAKAVNITFVSGEVGMRSGGGVTLLSHPPAGGRRSREPATAPTPRR
ncbi:hypothetical protein GCM10025868_35000 [Angustibacter aerolatus]|uniref:Uncharacterized protein n=1 Tax=Angustibacter aerolatus TaxID=1162965 RepID=A0ABQ6JLY4_9ACTN|nr:hypothetical protein GCM10025868_35000 [Angustibacter aerolatus]